MHNFVLYASLCATAHNYGCCAKGRREPSTPQLGPREVAPGLGEVRPEMPSNGLPRYRTRSREGPRGLTDPNGTGRQQQAIVVLSAGTSRGQLAVEQLVRTVRWPGRAHGRNPRHQRAGPQRRRGRHLDDPCRLPRSSTPLSQAADRRRVDRAHRSRARHRLRNRPDATRRDTT
jgi:hypothetical protein